LRVPIDWSKPSGATVSLAVARRPAKDQQQRVGTLFFNPGGPGDGAAKYIVEVAEKIFSPTLIERFDLVGMDPRGIENSSQVRCSVPVITPESTLFPKTEQQFNQLRKHNRAVGLDCLDKAGELVRHMDTVSVARDHEALRLALGEDKINWLGVSYGTQLGANYAQLYPTHTRAMVLDAALEHSLPEVYQLAGEIMAAEESFNRFADWCPTAETCALRGQDVRAVFDRLVLQADQNPIPAEGALRAVTGEDIRMGTKGLLRFKEPSIFGRCRRRSMVTGPHSPSLLPASRSTEGRVCSPLPAWITCRRCTPTRKCSSGWNSAVSLHRICRVPQKPGRSTSASTGP
jgi:pimeloyl-ACP methyl ester carboxylesterase